MTNTKTLMLAAAAALSLGVGTAMAQDGPDSSFPLEQQHQLTTPAGQQAVPMSSQPQAGSSDVERAPAYPAPTLIGGDGSGG
jgi:hypothetical protein